MARVNRRSVQRKAASQAGKKIRANLEKRTKEVLQMERIRLMQDFDNHPITQEIEGGPRAANMSMTLGGYGNLFSFLGFNEDSRPVEPLRKILLNSLRLQRLKGTNQYSLVYRIIISIPSEEEILAATPLHWAKGKSWVEAVEQGFSGLGQYLHFRSKNVGRSGSAIEAKVDLGLRPQSSTASSYLSDILRKLIKDISTNLQRTAKR